MEAGWQLSLAYAAGKQWLGWHDRTRTLRTIAELDPRYKGRELYTADAITEYRTTALGELGSDNDRPQLLLRRDDAVSDMYQSQLNRAVSYGWDHEWHGDDVLAQVDRFVVDLGTAAVRCRYDPAAGPLVADSVPHVAGRPVLDPSRAVGLMAGGPTDARVNRLRDHVWLFDFYERPTKATPQGRVFTFASNELKLIDHQPRLPYVAPDGTYRSGIAYFHWWRVTGRFWSRSLVDVLRDAQRGINKRRTQINEVIDRNMPFVIVQTDSRAKRKSGLVNEIVEVDPSERAPQVVSGAGPGAWMQADVEAMREDLAHASGINGPRRGENPQNVSTYSQLSLI